jgi:protein ImuB
LRLSDELVDVLTQLGIASIEQVLELPRTSIASRFGDELLRRVDQLTGCVPEVVAPHRLPPPFATQWLLEHPTTNRDTVRAIVHKLIDELVGRLLAAGEGAVRLVLTLGCGQEPLRLRIGLFRSSADAQHLSELVELQLENLQVPEPIDRVELAAPITARLAVRQQELFDDGHGAQSRELAELIDRLSSRLGIQRVVRPQLGASALPERACRYVPLAGGSKPRSTTSTTNAALPRPLLLFAPRPIELVSVAPDGPPQCVWLGHGRQNVTQSWGPERIETGWWRGPPVARDYYRIETEEGSRLWVFRRLSDGQWFAQGEFG